MEQLKAKLKKQGGFTMVELLIVVAIIGILAAVSIPLFNNALEKARHGVDAANRRDAISLGSVEAVASLNVADEFKDYVYYDYVVDNSANTDYQGELIKTSAGSETGVKRQCTNTDATDAPLQVRVKYDATTGTTLKDHIIVETNWTIGTDGHISTTKWS